MDNRIAVIDMDSVCYVVGQGNKVLDEQGNPVKALSGSGNMVFQYVDKTEEELQKSADWIMNDILTKCGATHYIGWMKGARTTAFRLEVNPEYKSNRKQEPPRWWNFVQNHLFLHWQCKYIHDMEVDDAVNITRLQLPNSFIVAIDGDLLGLEGTHYNWKTQQWITTTEEQSINKFWSDMVCGQAVDNVKGVPKRGKKYFQKLADNVKQYGEPLHTTVLDLYIDHFGEYQGIKEFYKNYISLFILKESHNFVIPDPIIYQRLNDV
jgi:5'-3' exonuclease